MTTAAPITPAGCAKAPPVLRLETVADLLGKKTRDAVTMAEDGRFAWCFDIALAGSRRREIRILTEAVSAFIEGRTCKIGTLSEAVASILPAPSIYKGTPSVKGTTIQARLVCGADHVRRLVQSGELQAIGNPSAPKSTCQVSYRAVIIFLHKRCLCDPTGGKAQLSSTSITIHDGATGALRNLANRIGATGRTRMNRFIGHAVQQKIRSYLIVLAGSRHASAERVGGTPTGFLAQAAEQVAQPECLSADSDGCTISVYSPGMGRAFHDVTLRPGEGRQYLTIPIAAEAYGQRIAKGDGPRFPGGFFFTSKKGNLLYGLRDGEGIHPLYLLKNEVHQKQDRTLLPSDEELMQTACAALAQQLEASGIEATEKIESIS